MQRFTNQEYSQAVTLINKHINASNWRQLPFPSSDIVVTQLNGPFGKITIFNIYNDSKKREVIPALTKYLEKGMWLIHPTSDGHIILMGDFNAHHHLWEEARNDHLCASVEAQETAQ